MGFEPIVTGATIQRVSRFATATPVGTRDWCPITELNCYLLDVSQVSYHWTNGILVRRPGLEPGSAGLKVRCSIAIELATRKLAGKVGLEPTYDTLTVCSPTAWCTFQCGLGEWI